MKLLVVRHGETHFNAEKRYLGALDPELNATGISQAQALRTLLPGAIDAVVCSPLRRARETAEILCLHRGFTPCVDDAFRERNVGVYEGLTQREAQVRFPELWARNITHQWHDAPTGGETIAHVVKRIAQGLGCMQERYRGQVVGLVAHGFVAKVARAITGAGFDDFFDWQLANGAICEILVPTKLNRNRWSIVDRVQECPW